MTSAQQKHYAGRVTTQNETMKVTIRWRLEEGEGSWIQVGVGYASADQFTRTWKASGRSVSAITGAEWTALQDPHTLHVAGSQYVVSYGDSIEFTYDDDQIDVPFALCAEAFLRLSEDASRLRAAA